jgi:hypothetical protein
LKTPNQEVRVKANIRFIEKTAKHPDRWNLVKKLSERKAEVQEMI